MNKMERHLVMPYQKVKFNRDPRIWPCAGDKLKDRNGQIIVVPLLGPGETRDLLLWRKAMKDAEVIEVSNGTTL